MSTKGFGSVDARVAAAEAQLDRADDEATRRDVEEVDAPPTDGVDADGFGFHVDDPDADLLDDDLDAGLRDDVEADAIDALAEPFNARDVDGLLAGIKPDAEVPGLTSSDLSELPDAIHDLWRRRPTGLLTRGYVEREHVGVLWEHDGEQWWRTAVVHVDDVEDGQVGVFEFSDDPALLERIECEPPGPDELEEGQRWAAWDEGADDSA